MKPLRERIKIGVIGGKRPTPATAKLAYELGREIGRSGAILVSGGLSGVMEEACRGAREAGGVTVGILPGSEREEANPYVDIPLPTGMGIARNVLVVRSSEAIIALPGSYGTLSEIALALNLGIPVIGLKTGRNIPSGVIIARDVPDALAKAKHYAQRTKR